ncbi:MAG TPA: hypothetical protein VHN77_04360, partial [Phycisphaerales bacterium]|nr:hypothetical protein [Phycisphaerales bacterium]
MLCATAIPALAQPYATGKLQADSLSVYKASAASTGQGVRPYATQGDTPGFDGGGGRIGGGGHAIDLFHGAAQVMEVDIALPCQGPGVVISRSFNGVQNASSSPLAVAVSSRQTSDGF